MAQVRLVTANLPPHSVKHGKEGVAVAILKEAEKYLPFKSTIEVRTINRALNTPKHHEWNTLLFPVSRSKERETKYRWIVPLYAVEFAFAHTKEALSIDDAKKLDIIGVRQNSMFNEVLTEMGFKNVYVGSPRPDQLANMLERNRLDAWFGDSSQLSYILERKLKNKQAFKISAPVGAFPTYLADDGETDEKIITAYRQAIIKVQQSDFYKSLLLNYPTIHPITKATPVMP